MLTGEDGNVFNLIGIATRAVKEVGQRAKAKELLGSYGEPTLSA